MPRGRNVQPPLPAEEEEFDTSMSGQAPIEYAEYGDVQYTKLDEVQYFEPSDSEDEEEYTEEECEFGVVD
jgi:hypothetical protein